MMLIREFLNNQTFLCFAVAMIFVMAISECAVMISKYLHRRRHILRRRACRKASRPRLRLVA